MPSILFFTLGLILLYKKDWSKYYILFIVATFNKETACFLTFIYLFTAIGKTKPGKIAFHCFLQLVIWLAIKYFLYRLYAANPGPGLFEINNIDINVSHLTRNVAWLLNLRNYPIVFFKSMGFIWVPTLLGYSLIKDEFIKRSLWVVFPFLGGMMFVANIYELRIYGEIIPLVLTAFLLITREFFRKYLSGSLNYLYASLIKNA
ncbi:MAG: hypothetical protein PHS34_04980 [Candidatus Omnitrophica bacterium]|nr:hypothetical protein [Candidatus Omnitrophota bacterium]